MGFLLGAFGKIQAHRRYLQLQYKQTRIQAKLNRVTKQVTQWTEMLKKQKQYETNCLNTTRQGAISDASIYQMASGVLDANGQQRFSPDELKRYQELMTQGTTANDLSQTLSQADQTLISKFNAFKSEISTNVSYRAQIAQNNIDQKYENLEQVMLEPIKQEEEQLEIELEIIKTQTERAKQEWEAYKEMEKSGLNDVKPQYTGSSGS